MRIIVLDTNFLIDVIRFKIDLDELDKLFLTPFELFTLDSVIRELEKISNTKSQESKYAKVALELSKIKKIKILKVRENPDKAILSLANKNIVVATNDIELRKKLKRLGIKTIYLKSKKQLDIS
jgi:rRNA-processing protein FCF1